MEISIHNMAKLFPKRLTNYLSRQLLLAF